jgi:pilus assembly protein CpaD
MNMTTSTALTLVLASTLMLGACGQVTGYSAVEAPKQLTLDSSTTRVDLGFAPGTAYLSTVAAARLRQLAASGSIGRSDRVFVAAAGPPDLAAQRVGAVAAELLHYGVVASPIALADMRPNGAVIEVTRTLVTLPPCPNWSKLPTPDYGNQPSSNFGCATQVNLGMMVARPTDLASGTPLGPVAGQPAAAAVNRYLTDKITPLPSAGGASPFTAAASSTTPTAAAPSTGGQ